MMLQHLSSTYIVETVSNTPHTYFHMYVHFYMATYVYNIYTYIPYSLKLSRVKIFEIFVIKFLWIPEVQY